MYYLWENVEQCNHDVIYNIIQQEINDVYMQNIFQWYHSPLKERFINTLQTDVFCSQTCQKQLISNIAKIITKFRVSKHLLIKYRFGRYRNDVKTQKRCTCTLYCL